MLLLLLLCVVLGLSNMNFCGEPVDGVPQAAAQEAEHDEVDGLRGYEEDEEEKLQSAERGVGGDEEGGCWAGGEDGFPEGG